MASHHCVLSTAGSVDVISILYRQLRVKGSELPVAFNQERRPLGYCNR